MDFYILILELSKVKEMKIPAQDWCKLPPLECQRSHWLVNDENVHVFDTVCPSLRQG